MRKVFFVGLIMCGLLSIQSTAQVKKFYYTSGGELIFSSARVDNDDLKGGGMARFTGFINFNSLIHYNFSSKVGVYTGLELQNVGFIYKAPGSENKDIYRSYNISTPIGLKFGRVDRIFFYTAYTIEKPIHYKEKVFVKNELSHDVSEWFSRRTPDLMHGLSVGVQLPKGIGIKAKYIFTGFFNREFKENRSGTIATPYQHFNANLFYISLTYNVLRTKRLSFNPFL